MLQCPHALHSAVQLLEDVSDHYCDIVKVVIYG